jgi:hypothetical protein
MATNPLSTLLASLDRACRDHRPSVSATLTTMAFDHSRSRWLGISDLIAEPEGSSFISSTVARRACGPAILVTQDPTQTSAGLLQELPSAVAQLLGKGLIVVSRHR